MSWHPVSPEVMQAAQITTGATMAGYLLIGFLPRGRHSLRLLLLVLYLLAIVVLVFIALRG